MHPSNPTTYRRILGIRFFVGSVNEAVEMGCRSGLVVAPAAPLLLELSGNPDCRQALLESDLALTDSGLMVLLWNLLMRDHIPRVSGLEYLQLLLARPELKAPDTVVWVMSTPKALAKNKNWLARQGFPVDRQKFYLAPQYSKGPIADEALRDLVDQVSARQVILGISGGTQERLGFYLKENCQAKPAIHCIGAAIGFLSGEQARIPDWADRWRIGWLCRCVSNPRRFVPRYLAAFGFVPLLWRYRSQLPPLKP